MAKTLGPEFPAILGGLAGLAITVVAAKKGFLTPKNVWLFESDHPECLTPVLNKHSPGLVKIQGCEKSPALSCLAMEPHKHHHLSLYQAWLPYALVAVILVLSRLDFYLLNPYLTPCRWNFRRF
ncbi:L-lactate permease [Thiomicrorhabdus aquaedulcis]|uniref:L-lactate permease n=1 Tax=Thiomicrorhabdus aquaedulcis TaxID=2211106 RepID=UPI003B82EFDA